MSGWSQVFTCKIVKMFIRLSYSGKFNVYLRQSIHFRAPGCSENCNNQEMTDKHSTDF